MPSYRGHRYPVEIINHCIWLYVRFPLSFREVEELMLACGVAVSYETIRRWCAKFGQAYANQLRRRRPRPGDKWHLDEVFVGINGRLRYLWRAVDQHGNVLDVLVQSRRNAVSAKRFFRKLLKGLRYVPRVLVTDKLGSYQVAHRELMSSVEHRRSLSEQPRRKLSSAHPATRTGDETLHIVAACATVPVRLQRHLRTLSAATASAQRDPMANRDGRPLRGLASGHRARHCRLTCERLNGVRPPPLQNQLRHNIFKQRDSASRTVHFSRTSGE
jgi:putative transposase